MTQLHKKFTDDQVKTLIERYLEKEIESHYRVVQKLCNVFLDILSMFCIMKVWKQQNILSLKFGNEP